MNILEITGEPLAYGGQERFLINLLESMDYTNLRIDVLTPYSCENASFRELVQSKGGSVYELNLPFRPGKSRRLLLKPITSFLKSRHYDVVHIHSGSTSVLAYASIAAKNAGVKTIIVHSHSSGMTSVRKKLTRLVFGLVMDRCATHFLACSREAGEMKFPAGIVKEKLLVVKNGIPIKEYSFEQKRREKIREKLSISRGAFVAGHVGRFAPEKNHAFLIELFDKVHREIPDSTLLLVGDGELMDEIKETVRRRGLDRAVIFTGNVDNARDYYQAMDVFLLPSLYEGLGIVAIEAQATGIPCILSTNVPEEAKIADNVVRLSLDDPDAWLDTVLSLRGSTPQDNASKLIAAGYAIQETAKQIRDIYLKATPHNSQSKNRTLCIASKCR